MQDRRLRSVVILLTALSIVVFLTVVLVVDGGAARDGLHPEPMDGAVRKRAVPGDVLIKQDRVETLRYLGIAAIREGRYKDAKRHFLRYLDRRPERLESYLNLSITHLLLDEPDAALDIASQGLERAQSEEPGPFHFLLACAYYRLGEQQAGARHLRRAHDGLGAQVHEFAGKQWATPLRQSQAYQELRQADGADGSPPAEGAPGGEGAAVPAP